MIAVVIQGLLAPGLYVEAPVLAITAFAILVLMRARSPAGLPDVPCLSVASVGAFVACNVLIGVTAYHLSDLLRASRATYSFAASVISLLKLLVLLPGLILFPADRRLARQLAPELFATFLVLFTYSPQRLFHLAWPGVSQPLGVTIANLSSLFVPGTHLEAATDSLVVVGPKLDMSLDYLCSGISGVRLFQLVFGMIIAVEWNRIKGARALLCYAVGVTVYLLANVVRLAIIFITGNLVSQTLDLNAYSWVLFVVMFMAIIRVCYSWMVPAPACAERSVFPKSKFLAAPQSGTARNNKS